ncbi:unnamed protein product [Rotaria sp. Silwood1]|nr:unnamed protein product [Rotaria sp. Silwood1]CAF1081227.1 unnamed protein product [Rotaria sp. Silwood1]CAF3454812.1 unnamed protein product [Rotaria sp. Silwood1]CAF4585396.1 unnamed protein product [Rotaria sp. Silwood1]CAF4886185.1 unnamed protein product [Rotaria sp. Silwood1]
MASATVKKFCATCHKHGDVFTCRGCRKAFCTKHIDEHRETLSKKLENLAEELDLLRNGLNQENEAQSFLSMIDKWEQESIAKICLAAENARSEIQRWIDRNNIEVKIPFERITNELRSCQQTDDYNEIDLRRWVQQLEEYRSKIEKLPIVNIMNDNDSDTIHLIKLGEMIDQIQSDSMTHSTPILDNTSINIEEPILLVREKFDDVIGSATLSEDGLVATYSGPWLGDSSICGVNVYSTGTHHIRFRILEKFYDSPFFGIVTASQKNKKRILESVSTNGWWNFDFPIMNGEKENRVGKDKIIRAQDDITLTLDCERKQIFLKHHRTKRLLHLPIDLRACPFPWKILVVLHRRGDSLRIIGGTLSVTRENISSRLSEHRKM